MGTEPVPPRRNFHPGGPMRSLPIFVPVLLLFVLLLSLAGAVYAQQGVGIEALNEQWVHDYLSEAAELEGKGTRALLWFVVILAFGWLISVFQIVLPFSATLDTKLVKILLAVFVATMTSLVAVKDQMSPVPAGIYKSAASEIRRNLRVYRSEAGNLYLVLKGELLVLQAREHYKKRLHFKKILEKILSQVKSAESKTIGTVALPSLVSVAYAKDPPSFGKIAIPPNTSHLVYAFGVGEGFLPDGSFEAALAAARQKLRDDVENGFLAAMEACRECSIPSKLAVYFVLKREWLDGIGPGAKTESRALDRDGQKFVSHVVIKLETSAIVDSYLEILTLSSLGQKTPPTAKLNILRRAAMEKYFQ